jgi:hypothetical protein
MQTRAILIVAESHFSAEYKADAHRPELVKKRVFVAQVIAIAEHDRLIRAEPVRRPPADVEHVGAVVSEHGRIAASDERLVSPPHSEVTHTVERGDAAECSWQFRIVVAQSRDVVLDRQMLLQRSLQPDATRVDLRLRFAIELIAWLEVHDCCLPCFTSTRNQSFVRSGECNRSINPQPRVR